MKTLIKYLSLTITIIVIHNLQVKAQEKIKTFNLTGTLKPSTIKLTELGFADIEYIPLQTNELSLISDINIVFFNDYSINKLISVEDFFIIKNRDRVLKFGQDGSFLARIGKIGRGPTEINQIEDLDVDRTNNNVFMVSGWQKKFYQYSPKGDFNNTFKVPFYVREFRFIDDMILCYCGNNRGDNENSFVLFDKQGNTVKKFSNKYPFTQKSGYGFTHEILFYTHNKKLLTKEICSDTVYSFDNKSFKPYFVINVGKKQITSKVRSESNMYEICANYIQPMNLLEFGGFVFYAFIDKFVEGDVRIYGFIGSKKYNYQVIFSLGEGITNDIDGGPGIIPLTTKDDNTIITLIEPLTLKRHILSEEFKKSTPKYPDKKKELKEFASRMKETDNPILVIVKMR